VFWVTLTAPRNALLDVIHPYPALKKALLRLPGLVRPGPKAYGFVLGLDESGRIVRSLQDPSGRAFAFVTNAVEHEGMLYMGSLSLPYAARVALSPR